MIHDRNMNASCDETDAKRRRPDDPAPLGGAVAGAGDSGNGSAATAAAAQTRLPVRPRDDVKKMCGIADGDVLDRALGDLSSLTDSSDPIWLRNVMQSTAFARDMLHAAIQHAVDAGRWGASDSSGEGGGHQLVVGAALEALPLTSALHAVVLSLLVRNHPRLLVAPAQDTLGDAAAAAGASPAASPHRLATMRRASLKDLTAETGGEGRVESKGLCAEEWRSSCSKCSCMSRSSSPPGCPPPTASGRQWSC